LSKGAHVLHGGRMLGNEEGLSGSFYQPTVLTEVAEDADIATEETFGPVLPVWIFDTEAEVIQKANHTLYGLASYFYTKDLGRAIRVSEALDYGIVGVNDWAPGAVQAPFGGMKESGFGREGGHYGVEEYLETKYISLQF
jgi:succinate-semialdehyde dehydrogenase/glutarate-semialdehyde dehydrogenase